MLDDSCDDAKLITETAVVNNVYVSVEGELLKVGGYVSEGRGMVGSSVRESFIGLLDGLKEGNTVGNFVGLKLSIFGVDICGAEVRKDGVVVGDGVSRMMLGCSEGGIFGCSEEEIFGCSVGWSVEILNATNKEITSSKCTYLLREYV